MKMGYLIMNFYRCLWVEGSFSIKSGKVLHISKRIVLDMIFLKVLDSNFKIKIFIFTYVYLISMYIINFLTFKF